MNIYDNIRNGLYDSSPFPSGPYKCNCGQPYKISKSAPNFCPQCGAPVRATVQNIRDDYWKAQHSKEMQFKRDVLEHFQLQDHPKCDKIFNYAWDNGHAEGFHAVVDIMSDLADILK